MKPLWTMSQTEQVAACPTSAVLPRVNEQSACATAGQTKHMFLANVSAVGRDEALAAVEGEDDRDICEAIDVDALPTDGGEFAAEVALVLDLEAGTAREVGRDIGRAYGECGPNTIAGTVDVVALGSDDRGRFAFVGDYKTGWGDTTPADRNGQMKAGAVAASRAYGVDRVKVEIIKVRDGSKPWRDAHEYDALDLSMALADLRGIAQRVRDARQKYEAGTVPDVSMGPHCKYCPAVAHCPGQTGLVRAACGAPAEWDQALTDAQMGVAWHRIKALQSILGKVRGTIETRAKDHPIDLGNGQQLGLVVKPGIRRYDGQVSHRILATTYGADVAAEACQIKTSKAAIEKAIKQPVKDAGGKVAPEMRAILEAIKAAGGETRKPTESVEVHPKPEELPAFDAQPSLPGVTT